MGRGKPFVQISIRIDPDELKEIQEAGKKVKPVALNRSQMIGAAVKAWNDASRHDGRRKGKP